MTGFGYYLLNLCTWSYDSLCVARGYTLSGFVLEVLGLATTGLAILWLMRPSGPPRYPNMAVYCTRCGRRLNWDLESTQWFCPRCGEFRLTGTKPQPHH